MTSDPFDALRVLADAAGGDPSSNERPDAAFVARVRRQLASILEPGELATVELPPPRAVQTPSSPRSTTVSTTTTTPTTTGTTLVPYLCVARASAAIDWYLDVFGGSMTVRYDGDDGRVGHAELSIAGATVFLADEHPEYGVVGPQTLGGTAVSLHLAVGDVDGVYAAAVDAGAAGEREPADQPYGERSATVVDPFGHRWFLHSPITTPTLDEISDAMPGYTITAGPAAAPATQTPEPDEPVELGYFTISAPDTDRAAAFYGALFGWATEPGSLGVEYRHVGNTRLPLGIVPGPAGDPATLYFRVPQLEPYVARVGELGGRVLSEATYDSGRGAECVDEQGRPFQLWEPAPGY